MAAGSKAELVDEHVSAHQCKLAVDALLKHEVKRQAEQQESQLLPGKEQNVWLVITVKQVHPEKKLKPHKIPVAHPIVDPRTSAVCLITKDPQREYKDLLEEKQIRFISRVVGVEKLKGKFKGFEERRMLLKENDLFLADERVVPLLPALLGKKFFAAKKQPIPVCLTRKDLKGELERAISSTYFHQNQGTCSSIKISTLSQPANHVLANLKTALPAVVKAIKGGWDNIQSLHIKTNSSASLPIWSCDLGAAEGGRWDGLVDVEMSEAGDESEKEAESEEDVQPKQEVKGKGKKRAAEGEEEQEKPKKKAKSDAEDVPTKAVTAAPPKADTSAPSPSPTPATKTKKRKGAAAPAETASEITAPAPAASSSAAVPTPADLSVPSHAAAKKKERHRKRKGAAAADPDAPRPDTSSVAIPPSADSDRAPAPSQDEQQSQAVPAQPPKRKKRKAQAADAASETASACASASADTSAPAPATPTPSASRTRQPRAAATDFFDGGAPRTPAPVAPPPNTPAAPHANAAAHVAQTPVSSAIGRLAAGGAQSELESGADAGAAKPGKEKRAKKRAAAAAAAAAGERVDEPAVEAEDAAPVLSAGAPAAEGDEKKKKKRDKKAGKQEEEQAQAEAGGDDATAAAAAAAPAPSVTAGDVKAKRSASGTEKKKDRALRAKKSAKDALLGKKGL